MSEARGEMETARGGSSRRAATPEDLGRLFLELANEADVEGFVKLYEHDAQVAMPSGPPAIGEAALRRFYRELFLDRPRFAGVVQPALRCRDLALTSTRFEGGATAEIARRQPGGNWLWVIDQPNLVR